MPKRRASPQIEDGFTRIADELLEALCGCSLTSREYAVALCVIRKTYGWNKKTDRISASQIVEMTGVPRSRVSGVLTSLAEKNVISFHGERRRGITPSVGIQKDHTRWPRRDAPQMGATRSPQKGGNSEASKTKDAPKMGSTDAPQKGSTVAPKKGAHNKQDKHYRDYSELLTRRIRFGSLRCLLPADEVERWIAIRPGGRSYTHGEVSAWFLQQHPRLVAEGKDPLSTARMTFSRVRPSDIKAAINWVEMSALAEMTRPDDTRERDSLDDFAEAFGLKT